MEEKNLVKYEAKDGQQITLSFDIIKRYLVQGHPEYVTNQELMYYMAICKSRALNPFIKDCYLIKYSQKDAAAMITSIDYFKKRAKVQKDCRGWQSGIVIERDGEIIYSKGIMLKDDILLGGWFKATPAGWHVPCEKEVNLNGYIKKTKEGNITRFWSKENQPSQIEKVALSQGLRECWPDEFQQLYTPEEIGDGEMFKSTEEIGKTVDLNEKLKGDSVKPTGDIYKAEETPPPEKPKPEGEKEEEKEDPIRKLYHGLGDAKFEEFVNSHLNAIPGMEQIYKDEIRASWHKRAKKKDGLLEGKPYPLDEPKTPTEPDPNPNLRAKEEVPIEEMLPEHKEPDKPDPPFMIPCMMSYEERPEKDEDGRVNADVCDNICEKSMNCVAYQKHLGNWN